MRLNRQIHSEAVAYLYSQKTFVITIYQHGFDFLKHSGPLVNLPPLPYSSIKEFVIRIDPCNIPTGGQQIRRNLVRLCGLIAENAIHFKKLRIACMSEPEWRSESLCPSLWHTPDHNTGLEIIPPEALVLDEGFHRNFGLIAWENGFSSSLGYLISPLQLLHSIADEVIIEFPASCTGTQSQYDYDGLKQYYEKGLSGRDYFSGLDQDKFIADLRWEYKHRYGPNEFCDDICAGCIAYTIKDLQHAGLNDWIFDTLEQKEKKKWQLGRRDNYDLESWERWASPWTFGLSRWGRARRGCMRSLEWGLGEKWWNRVYHWVFPKSWRWGQWCRMLRVWIGMEMADGCRRSLRFTRNPVGLVVEKEVQW
ncbi:MAG: hypothetical protein Q9168_003558 [Polycauliona sp. 1 TL-2023]